ncbi:MAG: carboxypeptidase regulatory-like domain-containing protein, partial [Prevotella sp.]|nr:carboxypeptidase regulatory-like domain-containing protein [Prevotella sp.]
ATVFLNEIPYKYRNSDVHVVFEAEGYQSIDTVVKVQKALSLSLKRNNDLGVVFGRVVDFETEQPVEGATVTLQDMTVLTDALGQFRIEIPFAKQNKTQRVQVTKDGYQVWEGMYRPSATEPWYVVLSKY